MDDIEVLVGRIGKPHGLRGDVTIDVRSDEPERRFVAGARLQARRSLASPANHAATALTLTSARWHGSVLLARFAEIPDRAAAEGARGLQLFVTLAPEETPADPEEYYDHQLVGLTAYDVGGVHLGEVTAVQHGSAQDLLTITTPEGREALVPFVAVLVPDVDLAARRITIADRPGLVTPFPSETAEAKTAR